jgi:hypothetical protein
MNTTARPGPSISVRVCAFVVALGVTLATLVLVDRLATDTAPTAALLARTAATRPA